MGFDIIVDTREQNPINFSKDDCYKEIVIAKLDTGDYAISGLQNIMAIERKGSVAELAGNIVEDRFKNCLERMAEKKYKFLFLEFDLNAIIRYPIGSTIPEKYWSKIKVGSSFILSFLAQVQVKYGIHVIFAGDQDNAGLMMLKLFKRIAQNENIKY